MLIDRIMVVHVELHLRDDAAEVGNEAAEYSGLVHPAEHDLGLMDAGQRFHEQGIRALVVADGSGDQSSSPGSRRAWRRVNFELFARCQGEHGEQAHRIGLEKIVLRDRDAAAIEDETLKPLWPPADRGKREAKALVRKLLVELREEQPGQIPDRLRIEEVELHEALDRGFSRPVSIIHDLGDPRLIVEIEPLLGPSGKLVKVAADRP